MSSASVIKFGYTTEVLMIAVCGMIIASGVLNMEQFQRIAAYKGADQSEEHKKNVNYADMANSMYALDTSVGAVLGALILAMMTYQVGKGGSISTGFKGAVYVQHVFVFLAYGLLIMNCAYGLNVFKKAAAFKPKGECKVDAKNLPPVPASLQRQHAMMSARARAMGVTTPVDDAQKYASDVNKVNIAFIVTSSVFFAVYLGYLGYSSDYFKKGGGGGLAGGAFSEFFAY